MQNSKPAPTSFNQSTNSISCSQDLCTSALRTLNLGPADISERPADSRATS
jgi:hypothetical protein